MTRQTDRDDPLAGLRPPAAPGDLASAVLSAARRAFREPSPTIWHRLWANRPLRLGWSVATVALVLAHLGLSVAPTGSPGSRQARSTTGIEQRELEDVVGLPAGEISPGAEARCFGSGSARRKNEKTEEVSG